MILDIKRDRVKRELPVMPTEANNNVGIDELYAKIKSEYDVLNSTENHEKHRKRKIRYDIIKTVENRFRQSLTDTILPDEKLRQYVDKIYDGQGNPYDLALSIVDSLK